MSTLNAGTQSMKNPARRFSPGLSLADDTVGPAMTTAFTHSPTPEPSFGHEEKKRGAIFTKQSVVDFMLDLIEYDVDEDLSKKTLLEPSFGGGRFLVSAIDRLIASWKCLGDDSNFAARPPAIRAVELDTATFDQVKVDLRRHLLEQPYTNASMITSTRFGGRDGEYGDMSDVTSLRRFVASFSGHIAAEAAQ